MDKPLSSNFDELTAAIEAYKKDAKGSASSLIRKLEATKMAVEGPAAFLGRMRYQLLLNLCVVMATETGMIKVLVAEDGAPVSTQAVALETGQDDLLVSKLCQHLVLAMQSSNDHPQVRVLRHLYTNGVCDEHGSSTYAANDVTRLLDTREQHAACKYTHDIGFNVGANLPKQIHTTGIQMFSDQGGGNTLYKSAKGLQQFDYLGHNPEYKQLFDDYMVMRKTDITSSWVQLCDVDAILRDKSGELSADHHVVVDVGGGVGTDLLTFRDRHSGLAGRLVLEDLSYSLDRVTHLPPDVEKLPFDFFTMEQSVKGSFSPIHRLASQAPLQTQKTHYN
ncbi:MAG: hypothetical protein Q9159_004901 [Coniocarpon cinnabarinum]